jgi:hypothetical protein
MNQPPGTHAPADYEIRIEGHFDEYWSAWFGGLTLIREDEGTTTLRGAVTDQAQLHGLLAKVRDLGTTLDLGQGHRDPRATVGSPYEAPAL